MGSESFETRVIGSLEYCDDDVEDLPGNDENGGGGNDEMMGAEAVESFETKVIALVGVGMLMIMIWVGVRQDDDINL